VGGGKLSRKARWESGGVLGLGRGHSGKGPGVIRGREKFWKGRGEYPEYVFKRRAGMKKIVW